VSFRRTRQTLNYQITGHLSRALSQVTRRNEDHHENEEAAGNIDSSASGDSAHLSVDHNV
jgi:hypothetical protein